MFNYYVIRGSKLDTTKSITTEKVIYGLSTKGVIQLLVKSDHFPDFDELVVQHRNILESLGIDGVFSIKPVDEAYLDRYFSKEDIDKCLVLKRNAD